MNEKINMAAEKMEMVVEELGKDYKWKNFIGQEISYDEYYNEDFKKQIPIERVLSDQDKMVDILIDFYLKNDLEDFIILFAIYCNNYIRYNLHQRIDDENFKLEKLWEIIEDEDLREYLLSIQLGISDRNIKYFYNAIEIFKQYSLPYLYLFLDATKSVFVDNDKTKETKIAEYYDFMNKDLQKYVLDDSKYIKKVDNPVYDKNYLPYLSFDDPKELVLKAAKSDKSIFMDESRTPQERVILFKSFWDRIGFLMEYEDINRFEKEEIDNNFKNENIAQRLIYLDIPSRISVCVRDSSRELLITKMELIQKNYQLEQNKIELEKAIESKNALIDHHAHNWKHIIYPETVKEIAEALYNEGNTEYATKLFKAYNSENILKNDLQLLRLNYASSEKEMQKKFKHDILFSDVETGLSILNIIEDSFDMVIFRLIMEGVDCSYISEETKKNLGSFNDMEILRKSYKKNFIEQNGESNSIIKWFNDNIYSLTIDIDNHWKDVKIKKNNIAYTQLIEIFVNLIHNSINYGVKSEDGFINLKLDIEQIDDIVYYTLIFENPIDYESYFYEGSNQGIESIKSTLEKLNRINIESDKNVESVSVVKNENLYIIKLYFSEKLIVRRRS